jgi:HlyD family secretion protein
VPKRWRRSFGAVPALLTVVLLAACTGHGSPDVSVGTVSRSTVVEVVQAPATVMATATSQVTSPATGSVARLAVRDGQQVRAGQLLMVLASPQAQQALTQAEQARAAVPSAGGVAPVDVGAATAQADAAAASAFAAARQAAAAIPDPTTRATALAQVARAEAQYQAASAQVSAALSQLSATAGSVGSALSSLTSAQQTQADLALAAAQRAVDGLRVRAPIAGLVSLGGGGGSSSGYGTSSLLSSLPSSLQGQASSLLGGGSSDTTTSTSLRAGSPVSAGSSLATVTDTSHLTLVAQVDETDVLLVHRGVTADVELDALPGVVFPSRVTAVDVNPTASSRGGVSYPVRLTLGVGRSADGHVAPAPLPGMSAVAALQVLKAVDAVAVPASAVFRDGTQDTVWLVTNGTAHRQPVTLGAQGEATVQVVRGLQVGDQIVVKGADLVSDGQSVP